MSQRWIKVDDLMQRGYKYQLTEPAGKNFHRGFRPQVSPMEMLELGVFGGKYMTDCGGEFPKSWFENAKLCHEKHEAKLNFFGVNASQPLSVWRKKGWRYRHDPRGWFQWYCRYYLGRRCADDERQIKRWMAFKRHITQLQTDCPRRDFACRPRQRQALLHWAYDARKL